MHELGLGRCQSQDKLCYDLFFVLKLMRHSIGVALKYLCLYNFQETKAI